MAAQQDGQERKEGEREEGTDTAVTSIARAKERSWETAWPGRLTTRSSTHCRVGQSEGLAGDEAGQAGRGRDKKAWLFTLTCIFPDAS